MKWVKVAIGAVIAFSMIGLILGVVNTIITPNPLTIDFEIIDVSDMNNVVYSPNNLRDKLYDIVIEYGNYDNSSDRYVYYFVYENVNYSINYYNNDRNLSFIDLDNEYDIVIDDDYIMATAIGLNAFPIGSYHLETDINANKLSPTSISLITLVPLVFTAGVIGFLLVNIKTKKED